MRVKLLAPEAKVSPLVLGDMGRDPYGVARALEVAAFLGRGRREGWLDLAA